MYTKGMYTKAMEMILMAGEAELERMDAIAASAEPSPGTQPPVPAPSGVSAEEAHAS